MHIDHIAIWVSDLEKTKDFYENYFEGIASDLYHNPKKHFSSYFISFHSGVRLELMKRRDITEAGSSDTLGLAHFAISVGSKDRVDDLTLRLKSEGHTIKGEPRVTGDGYYESIVLDPEGNAIEITV